MKFCLIFCTIYLLNGCHITNSQGLQQLSYANADIGQKLIRSTVTTEAPPPTTKKISFFGGIRNFFSKKSTETPPLTSSHPPTTTTTTTTISSYAPKNLPVLSQTSLTISGSTVTTTTTTTSKPKPPKEDFPPLAPPRRHHFVSSTTPSTTTLSAAWSTSGNRQDVNFIPQHSPSTQAPTSTSTGIPQIEIASNSELEVLTEELFSKESTGLYDKLAVNYQGRTQSSATTDEAPQPLLSIDDRDLESVNSIAKMRLLYNNYELDTMVNEFVTPLEKKEENDFVDSIMSTSIMRHAMSFLQQKGKVTPDPKTHRDLIKTVWFSLYSRGRGRIGSSAFEHVFLTEVKNGTISGLHNWVYFRDEEKAGHADYKGFIKKVELGRKGRILKFRFSLNEIKKPVNAMFVGTSPELEIALYTVCFQVRPDKECPISLGGNKLLIRTHTFRYRGKNLIGSAFPEI